MLTKKLHKLKILTTLYSLVIVCPDPFQLFDGSYSPVLGTYNYGDTVTYSCNYGYALTAGDPLHTCDFFVWNGTLPSFTGYFFIVSLFSKLEKYTLPIMNAVTRHILTY